MSRVRRGVVTMSGTLRTLVVITNADGTLAAQALRPETADLDVGLRHADVREQEPSAEDGLREDIEDGVGDDLLVDVHVAGAVGDTPDAVCSQYDIRAVSAVDVVLTSGRRSR